MKKILSLFTVSTLALSSVFNFSVFAENNTALGDVDGDGVLTVVDTELLLKYCALDATTNTTEQLHQTLLKGFTKGICNFNINEQDILRIETFGDVDGDGEITTSDVAYLLTKINYIKGDVNLDGKVTSEDANIVRDLYLHYSSITNDNYNYNQQSYDKLIEKYDYTDTDIKIISLIGDIDESYSIDTSDVSEILTLTDTILGDIDGNGVIDASDASNVLSAYADSSSGNFSSADLVYDFNLDGVVNSTDVSDMLDNYAQTSSGQN